MKALLLLYFSLLTTLIVAQNITCTPKTDSSDVIRIAKKKNVYWTKSWQYMPQLKLDTESCNWILVTCKIEHSNKGKCRYTNGCTVSTTATLVVNCKTGKVVDLKKDERLVYNYE